MKVSESEAYELICTMASDSGFQSAISARGWLMYSSHLMHETMHLTDGSIIYRTFDGLFVGRR
jgi:hypothetical protein